MKNSQIQRLAKILFCAYLVALVWILLFKFSLSISAILDSMNPIRRSINLVPFQESSIINGTIDIKEILFNALIFLPFGGLMGIVVKTSFWKQLAWIFMFSLIIEGLQFILAIGATDITDLLMNTVGGLLGLLIYYGLARLIPVEKLDRNLTIVGGFLFTGVLLLIIGLLVNQTVTYRIG